MTILLGGRKGIVPYGHTKMSLFDRQNGVPKSQKISTVGESMESKASLAEKHSFLIFKVTEIDCNRSRTPKTHSNKNMLNYSLLTGVLMSQQQKYITSLLAYGGVDVPATKIYCITACLPQC